MSDRSIRRQIGIELDRLYRMEREADRARDSHGHRSPVDLQILAKQRATIAELQRIERGSTGPTDPNQR